MGFLEKLDEYFKYVLGCLLLLGGAVVVFCGVLWLQLGFDSTLLYWLGYSNHPAGPSIHFSTVITYVGAWLIISLTLLRQKVSNLMNFFYGFCCFFFFAGVFEWIYLTLYAVCHGQWWIFDFVYGLRGFIFFHMRNFAWTMTAVFIWILPNFFDMFHVERGRRFKPRLDRWTLLLAGATVASFTLWVFYPWPYQVVYNRFFPQTVYTGPYPGPHIKYDYIEWPYTGDFIILNPGVHAVNVVSKLLLTLTLTYVLSLKSVDQDVCGGEHGVGDRPKVDE